MMLAAPVRMSCFVNVVKKSHLTPNVRFCALVCERAREKNKVRESVMKLKLYKITRTLVGSTENFEPGIYHVSRHIRIVSLHARLHHHSVW